MRERFQDLSAHVLDEDDQLRAGLLAAINDDVVSRADGTPEIGVDDRIYLFTQIAGG
jgi:sulfur carrier protein ThiS